MRRYIVPLLVLIGILVTALATDRSPALAGAGSDIPAPTVSPSESPTPTPTATPTATPPVEPTPTPPPPTTPTPTPPPIHNYVYVTNYATDSLTSTEVHRVIQGYAAVALKPNFLDNDWDSKSGYDSKKTMLTRLTDAEERYLHSVTGLKPKTVYYIDLTSHTVTTAAFHDKTVMTDSWQTSSTQVIQIDANTTKIITTVTNHVRYKNVDYQIISKVYDNSPLVLDLNFDSRIDVAENEWRPHAPRFFGQYARMFDITGRGQADLTEWTAPRCRDGILVKPEGGQVGSALQMFGTAGGYKDGFEKLSLTCDTDGNGWIEGAELEGLSIWIDDNNDAVCQPNELHALSQFHVAKLDVSHQNYVGRYVTDDGKTHLMWDWWPATMELRKVGTP